MYLSTGAAGSTVSRHHKGEEGGGKLRNLEIKKPAAFPQSVNFWQGKKKEKSYLYMHKVGGPLGANNGIRNFPRNARFLLGLSIETHHVLGVLATIPLPDPPECLSDPDARSKPNIRTVTVRAPLEARHVWSAGDGHGR